MPNTPSGFEDRHLGGRPERLTTAERMKRLWLRVLDWAAAFAP